MCKISFIKKKRTFAAYKFGRNKIHDNAHSSTSDTRATFEVWLAQLDKYKDFEDNVDFLSELRFKNLLI